MPVPNDLTQEEEQMFAQHGVQSAGPGSEPVIENAGDVQQQQNDHGQQDQGEHGDRQPVDPTRRPNGQFASREEREAAQQGQGQQSQQNDQGQQGQQDDQGQQREPQMVPLAALHESRQRTAQVAQQLSVATARLNQIIAAQQNRGGPRQQEQQMPDLNEDPAGYIQALEQRLERFESGWRQDQETRQLDSGIENDEAVFAMQRPDYHQASDYYVKSRAQELLQFYPPEEAQRLLLHEAREIAKQSWQRGLSAAETIYNLATARGYNPGMPNREEVPNQGQQTNGQSNGRPSAQDLVNGVKNAQQASRSIGGGGGGGRGAELNADALLNMSDEEFEQYLHLGEKGANSRFAAIGG